MESENNTIVADEVILPSDAIIEDETFATLEEATAAFKALKEASKATTTAPEAPTNVDVLKEITDVLAGKAELSAEDYQTLEAKGLTGDFVNTYIEGLKAKEVSKFNDYVKDFGTMEDYAGAIVYAQNNWTEAQINAYNAAINSGNNDLAKLVVGALMKETKIANPIKDNKLILNTTTPKAPSTTGYATKEDMIRDMSDIRYKTTVAYREKVESKLLNTDQSKWYSHATKGV
jgi:hypothetical protein